MNGAATPRLPVAVPAGDELRILAGSSEPYVDRFGHRWLPDRYFSGGVTNSVPKHPIFGTPDAAIYRNRREGPFRYDIPLRSGVYELRLHFAETLYGESNIAGGGESTRIFSVKANGVTILDELDVIADAGSSTADIRAFKDISPDKDGKLHLEFESVMNILFLNGIEIVPGIPGRIRPVRIVAREQSCTDRQGRVWEADHYVRGGQLVLRSEPVRGAEDPEIYRGERFGRFTYSIPVPPGRYAVTLYMAETWFGPDKPAKGGAGSRIFDVLANGVALARNVDIFREAGGSDRAWSKTFHDLEPTPQGRLEITLTPRRNYACINALEVVEEGR